MSHHWTPFLGIDSNMEELATAQMTIGKEIQRLLSNLNKDGEGRKANVSYYKDRLRGLCELWADFEAGNLKLLATNTYHGHSYFGEIKQLCEKDGRIFEETRIWGRG